MIPQRKSHDELQRQKGCTGKHKHATRELAERALEKIRSTKEGRKHNKRLTLYKCRFCGCFHLGKSKSR